MPAYIVKNYGQYSIFSTVVMSDICPDYPSLGELERGEDRAREILRHMPESDVRALAVAERVRESDYVYDPASDRIRLIACAIPSCRNLISRVIVGLPPMCERDLDRARELLAPMS